MDPGLRRDDNRGRDGTRSHLYPQVREVLQALREHGVSLVVVTNKEERYTHAVRDAHRLTPLFDRVVSGDSLPTRKPHPAGVLSWLEQFRVAPQRALFVGDSSIDVATARNAGVAVWALPYGYNMGEPIAACGPDRVLQDFPGSVPFARARVEAQCQYCSVCHAGHDPASMDCGC